MKLILVFITFIFGLSSCYKVDEPNNTQKPGDLQTYGSGNYTFTWSPQQDDRPVNVYYYVPSNSNSSSQVLIYFHGAGRDAFPSREVLKALAEEKSCILLVPEFSSTFFPGSNNYNLGGVFVDGEDPNPNDLLPEERWTFSLIEPLFKDAQLRFGYDAQEFDAFGHSAGAQFLHRLLLFKPHLTIDRAVINAAGWYSMPDKSIDYPYGMGATPISESDVQQLFSKNLRVSVGSADIDPNSFNLRHTIQADQQGDNRLERSQYFYQNSGSLAQNAGSAFNWTYSTWPGVGHDRDASAEFVFDLLYP
jgi:predicted esterase